MESISQLLKELEPASDATTRTAGKAFIRALRGRSQAEIVDLSIQFAEAGLANLAAMCRAVAAKVTRR